MFSYSAERRNRHDSIRNLNESFHKYVLLPVHLRKRRACLLRHAKYLARGELHDAEHQVRHDLCRPPHPDSAAVELVLEPGVHPFRRRPFPKPSLPGGRQFPHISIAGIW